MIKWIKGLFKKKEKQENIRRRYELEEEVRKFLKGEIDNGHLYFMMFENEQDKVTDYITKNVLIELLDKSLSGDLEVIDMLKSVSSTHELVEIMERDRLMDTIKDCLPKEEKKLPEFKKEDILEEKEYIPNSATLYGPKSGKKGFNVFDHLEGYDNGVIKFDRDDFI